MCSSYPVWCRQRHQERCCFVYRSVFVRGDYRHIRSVGVKLMPWSISLNAVAVREAFRKFPQALKRNMQAAGKEAASDVIFPTPGVKRYPPSTAANQPPVPYYKRGKGTQYKKRNLGNSERYGTKWTAKPDSDGYKTEVGNTASYGKYLGDEDLQAQHMAAIGWRKLKEVAEEKWAEIQLRYQKWYEKTFKDVGL